MVKVRIRDDEIFLSSDFNEYSDSRVSPAAAAALVLAMRKHDIKHQSHEAIDSKSSLGKGICYFYQRGNCTRGSTCRYLHISSHISLSKNSPKQICFAYQRGSCDLGDDCCFRHDSEGSREGRKRDKDEGKCSRGDHCKYRHDRAQQVETDPELLCDVKLEDSSLSQKNDSAIQDPIKPSLAITGAPNDDEMTLTITYNSGELERTERIKILRLLQICNDEVIQLRGDVRAVSVDGLRLLKMQLCTSRLELDDVGLLQVAMSQGALLENELKRRLLFGLLLPRGLTVVKENGIVIAPTPEIEIQCTHSIVAKFISKLDRNLRRAPPDLATICQWKHTCNIPVHQLVTAILQALLDLPSEESLANEFRVKSYSSIMNKLFYRGKNLSDFLATTVTSELAYLELKNRLESRGAILVPLHEEDHTNGNNCVFYRYVRFLMVSIGSCSPFSVPVYYEIVLTNFCTPRAHEIYAFDRLSVWIE